MTYIDYYPNAERILTFIEAKTITNKEYQNLKKISILVRQYVERELQGQVNESNFTRYYLEYIIRNTKSNSLSKIEKEIVIANAILPDDIEIADLLNKNGFTQEQIKEIIRFRTILKNIVLNETSINEELKQQFKTYKQTIDKLTTLFKLEFGVDDKTIILNRICEILVTHPNYFETKIIPNTKKR